jgi:hypothetical protein
VSAGRLGPRTAATIAVNGKLHYPTIAMLLRSRGGCNNLVHAVRAGVSFLATHWSCVALDGPGGG